ncbi:uncharacterized protein LOC143222231 [Tachypleus tridentatus]|uniref:uncharacterized protein LOC143222231 n=1 Tax=Tachypleus tridentatus TaxID=6853 RepID=UPI003FD62422
MGLNFNKKVYLVLILRMLCIILLCLVSFTKADKDKVVDVEEQENDIKGGSEQLKEDMSVEILNKPEKCDRITKKGDLLTIHYKGTLVDGENFDSSYYQKEPFQFHLGIGQVIRGWDIGLTEMCIGEKRRLTIPSNLAYGESGAGTSIPPDATLIFETELLNIEDGPPPVNLFKEIDSNEDSQLSREELVEYITKQIPETDAAELEDDIEQKKLIDEIFEHEDKNKDGLISHEEFSGPKHDEL